MQTPAASHSARTSRIVSPAARPASCRSRFGAIRDNAQIAAPHYDLASLLNDSLFPPEDVEARLLERATGRARADDGYRRAVAQRALKATGTFAAFAARGSSRHLGLIPQTLGRATVHLLELPETEAVWRRLLRRSGETLGVPERLLH